MPEARRSSPAAAAGGPTPRTSPAPAAPGGTPSATIDLGLLAGPLAKSKRLDADDPRLARVTYLASQGDYDEAGAAAQALIRDRVYDVRLLGAFFVGAFLQGGVTGLPAVLDALTGALGSNYPSFGPEDRKSVLADNALGWLFRTLSGVLAFHDRQRDEAWTQWVLASDDALVDAIVAAADRTRATVKTLLPDAKSTTELAKLRAWFDETYRKIVDRQSMLPALTPKTPPTPPPPKPPPAAKAAPAPKPTPAPTPAPPPAEAPAAPADTLTIPASPALKLLLQKLAAFEALVGRGEMQKAAVVSLDVRRALESFDPKVYLPKLFSSYFALLSANVDELAPHWDGAGTVSWQILEQFYQVDLEAFTAGPEDGS